MEAIMMTNGASNIPPVKEFKNKIDGTVEIATVVDKLSAPPRSENEVVKKLEDSGIQLKDVSEKGVTDAMLNIAIDQANQTVQPPFKLSYKVHEATNKIIIKVLDSSTDEVLREIPPESRLNSLAKIMEFAGLIYDKKG